jgi:nucleoside diphosphate kinase
MSKEIAYAIITPYTIRKSRTGAILARLFGRTSSQLIGTQMIALTKEMAERYAASIVSPAKQNDEYRKLIREYIITNMAPAPDGRRHRSLMMVFYGENARQELSEIAGRLTISAESGETIRNAYGDLVRNPDGSVRYFEPAVLISDPEVDSRQKVEMWIDLLSHQPALLEDVCHYENPDRVQQTLVLIKPDSWRQRSARPGAIVDMFSRTGLRIIGCKLCRISVAQALEFYGPVKDVLCSKLSPGIGDKAKNILEKELELKLPAESTELLTRAVGIPYACDQFERIVQFMSGRRPSEVTEAAKEEPGTVACLALVYEGEDAVAKIRDVLGPTDPTKAPDGTVRREFGSDVMVNTAHASDSPENAQREMGILRLRESSLVPAMKEALAES